ncbi:hypothetical protein KSF_085530 [Reticulibacter mediterranei]|uniref:Uncharacterized protein n=1 Tax=Reticulibacter mediterranei TaxID=2778369 RepID=A0A8J3IX93_9CHLR|nr:hypothetical protein KSF_085530 [Reticulibacter mediterranei]
MRSSGRATKSNAGSLNNRKEDEEQGIGGKPPRIDEPVTCTPLLFFIHCHVKGIYSTINTSARNYSSPPFLRVIYQSRRQYDVKLKSILLVLIENWNFLNK